MSLRKEILIFVEDPGAANYVALLPEALAARDWRVRLLTDGSATEYLRQRGLCPEAVSPPVRVEELLAAAPQLLLAGTSENPDTLGLALLAEARQRGIPSIGAVDALANADYRFRGRGVSALEYAPDWLLVPDAWTREAFVALGYPADCALACGHPHYDAVRALGKQLALRGRAQLRQELLPAVPEDRPVVVFAAELSTGLNPQQYQRSEEYTLAGWGTRSGRTEVVLEEFLDAVAQLRSRPYLVLRLHPKNTREEFADYADRFDSISQGGSPLELIYSADLVVGMSSMLLLEAALLERPTLSILPRAVETHWLPTTRAGIMPCVTTRTALHSMLPELLCQDAAPASLEAVIPFGSQQQVIAFLERMALTPAFGHPSPNNRGMGQGGAVGSAIGGLEKLPSPLPSPLKGEGRGDEGRT